MVTGMEFWKTHAKLRMLLIAVLSAAGVAITIFGWNMTGKMAGLGIMIVGVICLLAALWIYNRPFQGGKNKKA